LLGLIRIESGQQIYLTAGDRPNETNAEIVIRMGLPSSSSSSSSSDKDSLFADGQFVILRGTYWRFRRWHPDDEPDVSFTLSIECHHNLNVAELLNLSIHESHSLLKGNCIGMPKQKNYLIILNIQLQEREKRKAPL